MLYSLAVISFWLGVFRVSKGVGSHKILPQFLNKYNTVLKKKHFYRTLLKFIYFVFLSVNKLNICKKKKRFIKQSKYHLQTDKIL